MKTSKYEYYKGYIYNKDGSLKQSHKLIFATLKSDAKVNKIKKYYLKYWTGSNRHKKLIDADYNRLLDFIYTYGIPYETGNDAPRGGATGDYIIVKFDKRNSFIKSLSNERN